MPRRSEVSSYAALQPDDARAAPAALTEALERSKAQVEAGLTVPLEPALDRLRASIARMKAKRTEQDKS